MLSSDTAATLQPPATTEHRRGIGRRFRPGESGNVTGKAKHLADPGELARRHVRSAIRALVRALTGSDPQAAVDAARALLAEAHGMPRQHIAVGMPNLTAIIRGPTEHETARANGEVPAWNA